VKGYMYILECADSTYYTGSTIDLERRVAEYSGFSGSHEATYQDNPEYPGLRGEYIKAEEGRAANYTKNRRPVKLVYYEEYSRIDDAFYREKQVQRWSRAKKEALILNRRHDLPLLAKKDFSKR
jgi:putative endonuclease